MPLDFSERNNSHRTLQELVSVNAWFAQDTDNKDRYTLHADVSFCEERIKGQGDTEINFKLSIRRCDIVFVLPETVPFRIDPSSVRMPRPLDPKYVTYSEKKSVGYAGRGILTLNPKNLLANGELQASAASETDKETQSKQTVNFYHETWKHIGRHHAWSVDGRELENSRLAGPVFNGKEEPRLTIVDKRSDEQKDSDNKKHLQPNATIKVKCLRDDIDIYDIHFKDDEKQGWFKKSKYQDEKLFAAREVLREAFVQEGLVVEDLTNDRFAGMTICDVAITIIDDCT